MTRVVNIYREPYDIYIGRAGRGQDGYFGNPFPLKSEEKHDDVIEQYRAYFLKRVAEDAVFRARVAELRGKRLGCFCKPKLCHGDVIANYLEGQPDVAPAATFVAVEPL